MYVYYVTVMTSGKYEKIIISQCENKSCEALSVTISKTTAINKMN